MACSRPSASTSSVGKVVTMATQAAPASTAEYSNCTGCALLNEAWLNLAKWQTHRADAQLDELGERADHHRQHESQQQQKIHVVLAIRNSQ
jgi:hypothetical protein